MIRLLLISYLLIPGFKLLAQDYHADKYLKLIRTGVFNKIFINRQPMPIDKFRVVARVALETIDNDTVEVPGLSRAEIEIYRTLINNLTVIDTTSWRDSELITCVIVPGESHVNVEYAISKFKPEGKEDVKFYKQMVDRFNRGSYTDKWIYTFSRPIIDETGNYAVLTDTSELNMFGCFFYKWNGYAWKEMLNISTRN